MNRREAIKILEHERYTDVFISDYRNRVHEALDLAIEALGEPTISEKESVEGDAESATTTDCISRQQAIEALTGWETEPLDEDIVRELNALPPVTNDEE